MTGPSAMKDATTSIPRRPPRASSASLGALVAALTSSCYGPPDERADRDEQVGTATYGELSVSVEDGLAAIRLLDEERLELWAGAPALSIELSTSEPLTGYHIVVDNTVQGAEASAGATDATRLPTTHPKRIELAIDLPRGATRVRIAEPPSEDTRPFRFAVLSDIQEAIDEVDEVFDVMNTEDARFALGAGDLTEQGEPAQLRRFEEELVGLRYPYFATLGNHELGVRPPAFHDFFGRGNFHFAYRGLSFSMLDSASATLEPRVYDWLDDWMARAERDHVVAMHVPPIEPIGVRNGSFASRNEASKLLARLGRGGVDLTLYGHLHTYFGFENAGIEAHVSGGGGAIPEKFDGIGRHFLVFDVEAGRIVGRRVVRVDD